MTEYERKPLDDFLRVIEPNLAAYAHARFCYLALKRGGAFELIEGRLLLNVMPPPPAPDCFQSENIRAGILQLSDLNLSIKDTIESLLAGHLHTPQGELIFPPENGRAHSFHYQPFHEDGIAAQSRHMQLGISGARRPYLGTQSIDWELKSATTPFDDLRDLCAEFSIGPVSGDFLHVKITAFNVAAISDNSTVEGTEARLVINLAKGLERSKASIGYRVIEKGQTVKRVALSGSSLTWTDAPHLQQGRIKIDVSIGAVVESIANYDGLAQSFYWLLDRKVALNPFRSVHQAFDGNLEVLNGLIVKAQSRGANARDLEVAISWLLWILGFSTTHIGGTPKTAEAPDLIASTPLGHFLVIECTTGILKEDSKLAHLVERAEKVKQALAASGNQHLKVLAVIVTTKTQEEVKADLEQAYKLGVFVITKENFRELFNRTNMFPDPNRLYSEAEEALRRLQNPPPSTTIDAFK